MLSGVHEGRVQVTAINARIDRPDAIRALVRCHFPVVATDNHSSRLLIQEDGAAYLRLVLHVGVALESRDGRVARGICQGRYRLFSSIPSSQFLSSDTPSSAGCRWTHRP